MDAFGVLNEVLGDYENFVKGFLEIKDDQIRSKVQIGGVAESPVDARLLLLCPAHALKVRLPSRTFLVTGDAVHLREALEREHHSPIDWDSRQAIASLRRIKRLQESEGLSVWVSHDPGDWENYRHAPACYE